MDPLIRLTPGVHSGWWGVGNDLVKYIAYGMWS